MTTAASSSDLRVGFVVADCPQVMRSLAGSCIWFMETPGNLAAVQEHRPDSVQFAVEEPLAAFNRFIYDVWCHHFEGATETLEMVVAGIGLEEGVERTMKFYRFTRFEITAEGFIARRELSTRETPIVARARTHS